MSNQRINGGRNETVIVLGRGGEGETTLLLEPGLNEGRRGKR